MRQRYSPISWTPRVVLAAFTLVLGVPAQAKTPRDLKDMVGAKADGSEYDLLERGYFITDHTHWWNEKTGICAILTIKDGRLKRIDSGTARDCGAELPAKSGQYRR